MSNRVGDTSPEVEMKESFENKDSKEPMTKIEDTEEDTSFFKKFMKKRKEKKSAKMVGFLKLVGFSLLKTLYSIKPSRITNDYASKSFASRSPWTKYSCLSVHLALSLTVLPCH